MIKRYAAPSISHCCYGREALTLFIICIVWISNRDQCKSNLGQRNLTYVLITWTDDNPSNNRWYYLLSSAAPSGTQGIVREDEKADDIIYKEKVPDRPLQRKGSAILISWKTEFLETVLIWYIPEENRWDFPSSNIIHLNKTY